MNLRRESGEFMADTTIQITKELQAELKSLRKGREGYSSIIQRALDDQKTLKYIYRLMDDDEFFENFSELRKQRKDFEEEDPKIV